MLRNLNLATLALLHTALRTLEPILPEVLLRSLGHLFVLRVEQGVGQVVSLFYDHPFCTMHAFGYRHYLVYFLEKGLV